MTAMCTFCGIAQDSGSCVALVGSAMDKFENLMEAAEFDKNKLENSLICKACNLMINNFFNFKLAFMEKEDELLNYIGAGEKIDLHKILTATCRIEGSNSSDILKICRICFMTTEASNYEEIESGENHLAKVIRTCFPDFDYSLTNQTFVCLECHTNVLKYHSFLMVCMEAIKPLTVESNERLKETTSLDSEPLVKRRKIMEKFASTSDDVDPLLMPVESQSRGRGRPRKNNLIRPNNSIKPIKLNKPHTREYNFSYECQVCPAVYDSFTAILDHINFHSRQKKFSCWKCGVALTSLRVLYTHFSSHHLELFKILVDEDHQKTEGESSQNHGPKKLVIIPQIKGGESWFLPNEESNEYIECQLCLKKLQTFALFHKHIDDHIKARQFSCSKCSFWCRRITRTQSHMELAHGNPNLFRIIRPRGKTKALEESGKDSTEREASPVRELQSPGSPATDTEPVHCVVCSKTFDSMTDYVDHTCKPDRRYCCGHCSRIFYSLDELDMHNCLTVPTEQVGKNHESKTKTHLINEHIKPPSVPTTEEPDSDTDANNYECSFCNSSFDSVRDLDDHNCNDETEMAPNSISHQRSKSSVNSNDYSKSASVNNVTDSAPGVESGIRNQFLCIYCNEAFDTYADLYQSTHDCHKIVIKKVQIECLYCAAGFDNADELDKHDCPSKVKAVPHPEDGSGENVHQDSSVVPKLVTRKEPKPMETKGNRLKVKVPVKEGCSGNKMVTKFSVELLNSKKNFKKANYLQCVGCDFMAADEGDLLIHHSCCENVKKCYCCTFATNMSQKLERHCFLAHNSIVYACSRCRFVSPLEEIFNAHARTHTAEPSKKGAIVSKPKIIEKNHEHNKVVTLGEEFAEIIRNQKNKNEKLITEKITLNKGDVIMNLDKESGAVVSTSFPNPVWLVDDGSLQKNLQAKAGRTVDLNKLPLPAGTTIRKLPITTRNKHLLQTNTPQLATSKDNINSSASGTKKLSAVARANSEVIDIDSDSDSEFVESAENRLVTSSTVVEEIRDVDPLEVSQLISQGVPVVTESSLWQMQMPPMSTAPSPELIGSVLVKSTPDSTSDISETAQGVSIIDEEGDPLIPLQPTNIVIGDDTVTTVVNQVANRNESLSKVTTKKQNSNKSNKRNRTVKTVVRNNCIIICEDDEEPQRPIKEVGEKESATNQGLDDDCVVVEEEDNPETVEDPDLAETDVTGKSINGYRLYCERVKAVIEERFPGISKAEQTSIIVTSWQAMSEQEKWPFVEEARIHRLLFRREHPELFKPQKEKPPPKEKPPRKEKPSQKESDSELIPCEMCSTFADIATYHGDNRMEQVIRMYEDPKWDSEGGDKIITMRWVCSRIYPRFRMLSKPDQCRWILERTHLWETHRHLFVQEAASHQEEHQESSVQQQTSPISSPLEEIEEIVLD